MTTTSAIVYERTIGFQANQGRGFNNPVDLALDSRRVLYVLNRAGPEMAVRLPYKRVTMCTIEEDYLGEFGTGGTQEGEFWWPSSLAFDPEGQLYVADEALQRISVFDGQGQFLGQWGQPGNREGQLNRPSAMVFDGDGNLLVTDSLNHRVQKFTAQGAFLSAWGEYGSGPGQFNMPWGIDIGPDGAIYVSDWRNDRVQRFAADGSFLEQIGEPGEGEGQLNRPAGIALCGLGNLHVADWGNERVQIFDPEGQVVAVLRGDSVPSKWAMDYFAANPDEARAREESDLEPGLDHRVFSPGQRNREVSANIEKLFWGPTSVRLDDQGRIYVVDSLRHRVQVYRWQG